MIPDGDPLDNPGRLSGRDIIAQPDSRRRQQNARGESGNNQFTTETMKYYVDFAAKSGFPYFFLDAGWSSGDITKMNGRVDIPELVRYAAAKEVKVWVWLGYNDPAFLAQRHGVAQCPAVSALTKALSGLAEATIAR